ncbi:uncharacterized protein [Rutidosis leptorrhynchoides]|uniref:uncharacterized protein n=1 Tax=Rutidosis leptorrhynchoides TaxID=125765 RepID=UPI003A9A4CD1
MPDTEFDILVEELSVHNQKNSSVGLIIQGFEFQPSNMMQHDIIDMDNDDEEYWEKKLPDECQHFIKLSDEPLKYTTKKELYLLLCEGFLGHHGETRLWFFIRKSARGMCSMLPANDILEQNYSDITLNTHAISGSRFHEVLKVTRTPQLNFKCSLEPLMFASHNIYACYFVFKFQHNQTLPGKSRILKSRCIIDGIDQGVISVDMNLYPFNIPTIKQKNDDGSDRSSNTLNTPTCDIVEIQEDYIYDESSMIIERKDGWMEFMLCKPLHLLQDHKSLRVELFEKTDETFSGMVIEGIEFRPFSYGG